MTKVETARNQALAVLEDVFVNQAYSNIALNKHLKGSQLSAADKGLVTEIVYGTVARKLTLEWYLSHFIEDRDKLDNWLYILLLLSAYQLRYLDKIPNHAVVNEAVELAKARKKGSEKLVNAVLRRILREGWPDIDSIKRKNKRDSIAYSLPVWLVSKLKEEYGEERAQAIFESLLVRNKASIRVTNLSRKEEIKAVLEATDSPLAATGLVKEHGHFAGHDLFAEGVITIQDESSQLVAPTLDLQGDEQVLDACAAPGGKTAHMASYLTSGKVTALDLYDHKLDLIQENAERLGVADRVQTQKLDARKVHEFFSHDSFDKILVDAPCSGIGLLRRKPDIKYNKETADFTSLQEIQLEILGSVCQTLRKGGIITYSTCTIVSEENFQVVEAFLESHPEFEQVKLEHECKDILKDGCILITPELYGSDGFFISQFRKISE
ncbi:16S rRNA (cytosine(967)-C(5))-methyltransferase RsmB [Streptococcus oralis]|uniref:16S rRNA (cytosine(967)-C(5))-methyltransferase RsmB n=1 Tax=Streptococcus oralis TaxID=1303 RepID=UPI0020C8D3B9|nr:16S rRNA (cytosine(967)-C(5))-methyltransferase RsmB [Streptococcus oralis]MCP9052571.1 16S rRNA (cytosine(967)-C(5))-methyltransferase RsmB [Streptococcus oralis]MCP9057602.1 16S rRNA (cytosine(967)-C(5))-methyltransferase RsmB [Streptococcus oralis]MCP9065943.1 16S rRNA (cytosine(967)-C(5))-methyltransferase RsmB [Streptococcus oralis]MCP9070262.1 16S rRNA (cytosine(967)-C(5))-methyltransferase RsmB [Streptococcus oralis]